MADQTEIATVLPKELRLGVPPKMPQARSYLFRQHSTLSAYDPTQTITINIPRLQRSYLRKDSYLRFRVNGLWKPFEALSSLCLDTCGSYGFIDRIEVFDYLGSTVLESISGVPQLSALLLDLGLKELINEKNGIALAGLDYDYSFAGSGNSAEGVDKPDLGGVYVNAGPVQSASTGTSICNATATSVYLPFSREFAIPLPSFLGLLSDKMIPLHNGFTIVITLSSKKLPFLVSQFQGSTLSVTATTSGSQVTPKASTVPTYTEIAEADLSWNITDVYLNCQILELGPVAESMILSSSQGSPLVVHTKSFRNYVGTVKGATTNSVTYTATAPNAPAQIGAAQNEFNLVYLDRTVPITVPDTAAATPDEVVTAVAKGINDTLGFQNPFTVTNVGGKVSIASTVPFKLTAVVGDSGLTTGMGYLDPTTATASGVSVVATGQAEFVLNMNLNVASLSNVLWIMRPSSQLDSLNYSSVGSRTRNFLQRWQFQYGSTILPQSNGIQTMGTYIPSTVGTTSFTYDKSQQYNMLSAACEEGYQELMKARPVYLPASRISQKCFAWDAKFNAILDNSQSLPTINALNFGGVLPCQYSRWNIGRFAGGLNLQLANNKEGQIISGLNTNGMNTSIRGIFHPLYTDNMDSVRVDAWAEYDAFVNISPGIATTVSF